MIRCTARGRDAAGQSSDEFVVGTDAVHIEGTAAPVAIETVTRACWKSRDIDG